MSGTRQIKVPKVFHRIWLGSPEPAQFQEWGKSWIEHHPGWELRTWTEETLPRSRYPRLVNRCINLSQRANVFRYELLLREGGVYVDADLECRKNIEPLIDGAEVFASRQEDDPSAPNAVNCAFVGAPPAHPLLQELVADIPLAHPEVPYSLGALFFTAHLRTHPEVRIFDRKLFNPYRWDELHLKGQDFPYAYAIHHWSSKWFKPIPAPLPELGQAGEDLPPEPDPGPERARYAAEVADRIAGWMGKAELLWLAEQARRRRRIVEFGSFQGRSAKALALATSGTVWAVDRWNFMSRIPPQVEIWDAFNTNHAGEIAARKVVPLRMSTAAAAAELRRRGVQADMVFIDAGHSYEEVLLDVKLGMQLLGGPGSGGLLCGHDFNEGQFPGVVQAVTELVPHFQLPTEGAGWIWAAVI